MIEIEIEVEDLPSHAARSVDELRSYGAQLCLTSGSPRSRGGSCCCCRVRFHFKYEFDLEVTDEGALTADLTEPLRRPDKPLLESWSNISAALHSRLDQALLDASGIQLLGGGSALTPLDEDNPGTAH